MAGRGRPPGGRGSGAKFADGLVPHIREAYAAGRTTGELAAELGVRPDTVAYCVKGKTYRDLAGPISTGKGDHAARGMRNGRSKLDEARVLEIRASRGPWGDRAFARSQARRLYQDDLRDREPDHLEACLRRASRCRGLVRLPIRRYRQRALTIRGARGK